MRMLAMLVTACVVLAAAQAMAAAMIVMLLAAIIYGLFAAPRETLSLLGSLAIIGLIAAQPLACLGVMALAIIAKTVRR